MAISGKPMQNAAWLIAERVLRLALTAVVLAIVARYLRPEGFGQLAFAISFTGLFTPIAFLGLDGLLVSELVRTPERSGALLGTACVLRLASGIAAAIACVVLAFAVPGLRGDAWFIVPLTLGLLWQAAEVVDVWFQRHLQSRLTATVRLIAVAIGAGVKLILVWRGAPAPWFAWAVMGDVLLFELGLLVAFRGSQPRPSRWAFEPALARQLARRSWPIATAGVLVALQGRIDQFFAKAALDDAAAGAYFAAVRLTELPAFAIVAIGVSAFPTLASRRAEGKQAFSACAQGLFDLLTGTAWAAAIVTTLSARWIVPAVLGPAFAPAVPSLIILAWGLVPFAGNLARQHCILAALPTWLQMATALVGIGAQLVLLPLLVSRLGGPGAALASVAASIVGGFVASLWLRPLRTSAAWQARAFLIPFSPRRLRAALELVQ